MKIAYVASFGNTFFNGVFRKIDSQLSVWRALPGVEVETFFRALEGVDVLGGKAYRINWPPAFAYSAGFIRDIRHFSPDMIYLRHEICGPQMMELVRAFSGKVALEINADLDAELRLEARHSLKRRAAYLVNSVTSGYLEKHLGACVCVSSDFLPFFPHVPDDRKMVSPNCINLDKHPVCKRAATPDSARPALLFMGTPNQVWHGVDLLPPLAYALPEFDFHIVGANALPDAPPNMIFHGYQPPEKLQSFYARSHIGIGSLAFFRKNIYEASPLKVREYIAAGLPVILGCQDSAFKENVPGWVLPLEPGEDLFERPEIVDNVRRFVARCADLTVSHVESAPYIDAQAAERRKIRLLEEWFCSSGHCQQ